MSRPESRPEPEGSRARRFWVSFAVLVIIVLLVYTAARVLTSMGDQVPPAREPLPSSIPTLEATPVS